MLNKFVSTTAPPTLETDPSRRKLVQVTICNGSSCGKTEKGYPAIPLDWLKAQWKEKKLLKTVQLTIGGCFGACDLTNVTCVQSATETIHLGKLTEQWHYDELLAWAEQVATSEVIMPLPECLQVLQFELFRTESFADAVTSVVTSQEAVCGQSSSPLQNNSVPESTG